MGTINKTNRTGSTPNLKRNALATIENGQVVKVPALLLENREEARRFLEAIKRKELKNTYKKELDNAKTLLEVDSNRHVFSKERCKIAF